MCNKNHNNFCCYSHLISEFSFFVLLYIFLRQLYKNNYLLFGNDVVPLPGSTCARPRAGSTCARPRARAKMILNILKEGWRLKKVGSVCRRSGGRRSSQFCWLRTNEKWMPNSESISSSHSQNLQNSLSSAISISHSPFANFSLLLSRAILTQSIFRLIMNVYNNSTLRN